MALTDLRLSNFKCFSDQPVPLAPLTVLTGLNGMGKSSVLQALLLLRQSYLQGLLPGKGLALSGELVQLGTSRDALYRGAATDEITIHLASDRGANGLWRFRYSGPDSNVMPYVGGDEHYEDSLFSDACHYLRAERTGPRVAYPVSDHAVRQHRQLGPAGEYTIHFLFVFDTQPVEGRNRLHSKSASSNLKSQVEAWASEVSPGVRLNLQQHTTMDVINPTVSFASGRLLTDEFRSTNAGFGVMYVLPVVTALLASRSPALVLIENPEAHLHPQGQMKIAELICRAVADGVQVLVETHSDHILHGVRVAVHEGLIAPEMAKFHFFERVIADGQIQARITSPQLDGDGRLNSWPEGFFDQIDKAMEVLLTPRKK
jgi:predicted ATPase